MLEHVSERRPPSAIVKRRRARRFLGGGLMSLNNALSLRRLCFPQAGGLMSAQPWRTKSTTTVAPRGSARLCATHPRHDSNYVFSYIVGEYCPLIEPTTLQCLLQLDKGNGRVQCHQRHARGRLCFRPWVLGNISAGACALAHAFRGTQRARSSAARGISTCADDG